MEHIEKRWHVTVSYYGPGFDGEIFRVEELSEIEDVIEGGPDFRGIENITIRYASNVAAEAAATAGPALQ